MCVASCNDFSHHFVSFNGKESNLGKKEENMEYHVFITIVQTFKKF